MKLNAAGEALIRKAEGCRLRAYVDAVGVWTIGYGHTGDVKPGDAISQHQAEIILELDLDTFDAGVQKLYPGATPNQHSALVSFTFNLGLEALRGSHLLQFALAGDIQAAADQFPRWNHAGGRVLPALTARRSDERALFLLP